MAKRELSKNEKRLWNYITRNDLKIKKKDNLEQDNETKEMTVKKNTKRKNTKQENHKKSIINKSFIKEEQTFISNQIDFRSKQKLKRGLVRYSSKLDLHGFTKEQAFAELLNFIKSSIVKNHRCVLIITGRKIGPKGPSGVLRNELPKWLNSRNFSKYVLYHTHAHVKDGGDGATYLLLRKKDKIGDLNA